jgi:hypothetical protein
MTTILPRLFAIYRAAGYEPLTGYSSYHFQNWRGAPFTRFFKDRRLWGCPGMALQEVMFLEHLASLVTPQRVLVIGNGMGWGTIAMTLIFPKAFTVAIDIDSAGVALTNEMIAANGLNARAVIARSPNDVAQVVDGHLGGPVDLSLIDADHTEEAIVADFTAIRSVAAADALHLFHDVINHNLIGGFNRLLGQHGLKSKVFTRTPSGMALAYAALSAELEAYLDCFTENPETYWSVRRFCLETYADPMADMRKGYR